MIQEKLNRKRKNANPLSSETIAAIATPPGHGGVGMVRISGPEASAIVKTLTGKIPEPRYAALVAFKDADNEAIDKGIALYFKAPHSFTGEDVVELQGHGGPAVMARLLSCVIASGARLARPGEFSERAYLNDKVDLAQAEAIADLINATSEQAARSAMRSLSGVFSEKVDALLAALIQLRMLVEGAMDFSDQDIDFLAERDVGKELQTLIKDIEALLKTAKQGVLMQRGMTLVLFGAPNAGKSTVLNALTEAETAIVSHIPGTTRDIVQEHIHLDGIPVRLIDTAGLRETEDAVEQEGVRRAKKAIEKADVLLWICDITDEAQKEKPSLPDNVPVIRVNNKIDLVGGEACMEGDTIFLSAKTKSGIELLKSAVKSCVGCADTETPFMARQRHVDALLATQKHLERAKAAWPSHQAGELLAQDLTEAQQTLGQITGRFSADDLLGEIFSHFCIGK